MLKENIKMLQSRIIKTVLTKTNACNQLFRVYNARKYATKCDAATVIHF